MTGLGRSPARACLRVSKPQEPEVYILCSGMLTGPIECAGRSSWLFRFETAILMSSQEKIATTAVMD